MSLIAGEHGASGSTDGIGGAARFGYPLYLATDGVQTLYLVDGVAVRSINTITKEVKTIAGTSGEFSAPYGIAYEGGMLYVCDGTSFRIRALNPTTHEVTTFLGGTESKRVDGTGDAVRFINPSILVGNGKGTLYIVDAGAIRQVDVATRTAMTLIGRPELERTLRIGLFPGSVFAPGGITLDEAGDIILTDNVTSAVVRIRIPRP